MPTDAMAERALTSVALSPGLEAVVALAYVRREVTAPAWLDLTWEAGTAPVEVRELPLVAGEMPGGPGR